MSSPRAQEKLLLNGGGWARLRSTLAKKGLPVAETMAFGASDSIRVIGDGSRDYEDITTPEESGMAADFLLGVLRQYTEQPDTEIKLTHVARASLEELLEDYRDFLRTSRKEEWSKNCKEVLFVRDLATGKRVWNEDGPKVTKATHGRPNRSRSSRLSLYLMDAVEQVGSGVRRIREICRDYGVAAPEYEINEHWVTITFKRPKLKNGVRVEAQAVSHDEGENVAAGKICERMCTSKEKTYEHGNSGVLC